ncbi:hypothetical protein PRIPAC_80967 [Pristionchus pacificus]|uniref:G protein-coupled receptor n=1 Tax=Pristionchus pacificus TaxID=54126 RepID=A0A2A6CQB2_PRIPA|nr:hypothetical protein PRIPAC_80967 [Pristionchus pacificus]|eukprot:PDM80247.1 G protein-coupled receptor [Pristionchus pacificus]
MRNSTALRYGFLFEETYGLDAVHYFTTFIDIFCAIPVHAWVISIITLKPSVIRRDIRLCCLADQVAMMLYGFVMCLLLKPYPTLPCPGFYCSGIICQIDLDTRLISASIGAAYSSVVPFFCCLMIRLHNQVTVGSGTKWNIGSREENQTTGTKGTSFPAPELALLILRTGTVVVIGPPGEANNFVYEVELLFATCFLVVILLIFLTLNSMRIIMKRAKSAQLSEKTQQAQDRLTKLIAVFIFFVVPMLTWVYLSCIDITSWSDFVLVSVRASVSIALSLKPLAQSLIFLIKNPALRKQALHRWRNVLTKASVSQAS